MFKNDFVDPRSKDDKNSNTPAKMDSIGFSLDGSGKRNGVGIDGSELESKVVGSLNLEAKDAGLIECKVVEHGRW